MQGPEEVVKCRPIKKDSIVTQTILQYCSNNCHVLKIIIIKTLQDILTDLEGGISNILLFATASLFLKLTSIHPTVGVIIFIYLVKASDWEVHLETIKSGFRCFHEKHLRTTRLKLYTARLLKFTQNQS